MDDNEIVNAISLVGLAGLGGYTGYLWAGLLTASEIVAVSSPVGIIIGALIFVGLPLTEERKND